MTLDDLLVKIAAKRLLDPELGSVEGLDPLHAAAEIERLRDALTDAVALIERTIDTRRCSVGDLRTLNAARAALKGATT
jgi:hypothetical protein